LLAIFATSVTSIACGGGDGSEKGPGNQTNTFRAGAADQCKRDLNSPYPNDENCLEPPPPEMGFQLYFGPGTDKDYNDPNAVGPYVLNPGDEGVLCLATSSPNADDVYQNEYHVRTRTGTHHIIYWAGPTAPATKPADGTLVPNNCRDLQHAFYLGAESGIGPTGARIDLVATDRAPEDRGVATLWHKRSSVWIETHFVNTGDTPLLREAWGNIIYADPAEVTKVADAMFWIGGLGMAVPPGQTQVVSAGPVVRPTTITDEVRILGLVSHVHAHTQRHSIFLTHSDGRPRETIYESYNWAEPLLATFDTVHQNAPLGVAGKDGAMSGKLILGQGDGISWECEVNNTLPNTTLVFADRAYDAEMCNVFGLYTPGTGASWNAFN
jgi:hypothetical protein